MTDTPNETQKTQGQPNSTLIEFPGVNRNRPAWRKELSEKVREIQQRRAREAALEAEESWAEQSPVSAESAGAGAGGDAETAKQLGLVPPPEQPEMNPLVVAALRRIERARARTTHTGRAGHGRAQAAAARVIEEQYEPEDASASQPERVSSPRPAPALKAAPAAVVVKEEPALPEAAENEAGGGGKVEAHEKGEAHQHAANLVVVAPPGPAPAREVPRVPIQAEPVPAAPVEAEAAPAVRPKAETNVKARAAAGETVGKPRAPEPAVKTTKPAAAAKGGVGQPATGKKVYAGLPDAGHAAALAAQAAAAAAAARPRKVAGVIDDHWIERHEADLLPKVETASYDDRAPLAARAGAALCDLAAVAVLCAPFAAVIELTIGEWGDARVLGSMAAIVAVLIFLYHTCAVALAGRTVGMRLFSLHAVDADTARVPTTAQCALRALGYMLSLATFGLGLLYALFDAEGRTAHDLLSRTVVVKE